MWRDLRAIFSISIVVGMMGCATFSESTARYQQGLRDIRDGRMDFALLNLKAVVNESPKSAHAPVAMFALGEYYFDHADYFNAIQIFSDYISRYPKDKGVVFAKLLIYKVMAEIKKNESFSEQQVALSAEIRKELFSQPLLLIFSDKKAPRSYRSLFATTYLVYDYVDQIKVIRNEKIFLELAP